MTATSKDLFDAYYQARKSEDDASEDLEEKAKFPTLDLGLAGAGVVGGQYLPELVAGDKKHMAKMVSEMDRFQAGNLPADRTTLTDYANIMGRAAQTKFMGAPIGAPITGLRGLKPLMQHMEGYATYDPTTGKADPKKEVAARKHYFAFENGPIAAYEHQLGTKMNDLPVSHAGLTGAIDPNTNELKSYSSYMGDKFRNYIRDSVGGIKLTPNEITTDYLSLDEQNSVLEDFYRHLGQSDPAALAEKIRVEGGIWPEGIDATPYMAGDMDYGGRTGPRHKEHGVAFPEYYDSDGTPQAGDFVTGVMGKKLRQHTKNYHKIAKGGKMFQDYFLTPAGHGITGLAGIYGALKLNDWVKNKKLQRRFQNRRQFVS